MPTVNMLEAKTTLSKLVEAVESGAETEIIIARNGKPAARLVALGAPRRGGMVLGRLEGKYPSMSLEEFNATDADIARMMIEGSVEPPA